MMNSDAEDRASPSAGDEPIDLGSLTDALRQRLPAHDVDYVRGKTAMRDIVVDARRCSQLEAETIVDTLEARGFIVFERRRGAERWRFDPHR